MNSIHSAARVTIYAVIIIKSLTRHRFTHEFNTLQPTINLLLSAVTSGMQPHYWGEPERAPHKRYIPAQIVYN